MPTIGNTRSVLYEKNVNHRNEKIKQGKWLLLF